MYKCCICGTIYDNERDAVKCVNKCAREKSQLGIFQSKEAPRQEDITTVTFSEEIVQGSNGLAGLDKERVEDILYQLEMHGAPVRNINYLRESVLKGWEDKSPADRGAAINRLGMMLKIYEK